MYYAIWSMAWGWLGVMGDETGLARLVLPKETYQAIHQEFQKQTPNDLLEDMSFFEDLYRELTNYFNQESYDFSQFSLQWDQVTPYRRKVLTKALEIPYGETRTYKWLAEGIGNFKGYRSVGQAMATNPWPIIIPCHRVVGSKGKLTGFSGGLEMKQRLLSLEADGLLKREK